MLINWFARLCKRVNLAKITKWNKQQSKHMVIALTPISSAARGLGLPPSEKKEKREKREKEGKRKKERN